MPPGWTVDDITSGRKLEGLLEYRPPVYAEGLDEAESPKGVLSALSAHSWVVFVPSPGGSYFLKVHKDSIIGATWEWIQDAASATLFSEEGAKAYRDKVGYTHTKVLIGHAREAAAYVYGNQDEAEDPKMAFRLAKAAANEYYISRGANAYGEDLLFTHYLRIASGAPAWTTNYMMATRFDSEKQATEVFERFFPGQAKEMKVSVDLTTRKPQVVPVHRYRGESEDPKRFLKIMSQAAPTFGKAALGAEFTVKGTATRMRKISYVQAQVIVAGTDRAGVPLPLGDTYYVNSDMPIVLEAEDPKPVTGRRLRVEARERDPFDLLKWPTDASVLVAKLLDLEHDVKPAVL
jgi:hypothetical protein